MNPHGHTHSHTTTSVTEGRTIQWASHYDMLVNLLMFGNEKKFREGAIRQAAIPVGATVLDVGCGTGTLTLLAQAQAGEKGSVYGIDASPDMIHVAQHKGERQHSQVTFQQGVIEALPFPDGTFDIVLSSLMFHHLPGDLKRRGLAEIYRVLKPGGRVLIVDMLRPTNALQRVMMFFVLHGGMAEGVQDVSPLMKEIGFKGIQLKTGRWHLLGYLQGQR